MLCVAKVYPAKGNKVAELPQLTTCLFQCFVVCLLDGAYVFIADELGTC